VKFDGEVYLTELKGFGVFFVCVDDGCDFSLLRIASTLEIRIRMNPPYFSPPCFCQCFLIINFLLGLVCSGYWAE